MKKQKDEAPHYIAPDTNGGGQKTVGYWRQFLTCSDGEVVCGCAETSAGAQTKASRERSKHEAFLKEPLSFQLRKLVSKDMLHDDMEKAIKILAKLVLKRSRP